MHERTRALDLIGLLLDRVCHDRDWTRDDYGLCLLSVFAAQLAALAASVREGESRTQLERRLRELKMPTM